jgi:translation elongation factor EF-Ts
MKKEEILAIIQKILNDSDNDYELIIKKSGQIIETNYKYKIIPAEQYYIDQINYYSTKVLNESHQIIKNEFNKKIIQMVKIQKYILDNHLPNNEYYFNNKIELESFINNIFNQSNIYSYFNYEKGEIYFSYNTGEFSQLYLIANIELI